MLINSNEILTPAE